MGGLAGGIIFDGNVYEHGPHIFHTTDQEILSDIKALMGPDLLPLKHTVSIKFLGNYFKYPLSMKDVLRKLPPTTVLHAAASLAYRFVEGTVRKPEVETSETVLRRLYGDVLYKLFFEDYITRVWGIPPSEFSPAFARERIPRFNFLKSMEQVSKFLNGKIKAATGAMKTRGYVEKLEGPLYTTKRGFSMITERMADRLQEGGQEIRLDTEVVAVERDGNRIKAVAVERQGRRESIPCAAVINTLPINLAAKMITPSLGSEVEKAASSLRFRALVFVGVHVRRPKALPASLMYFREHAFNRITDLAHFSFHIEPAGSTLLIAESACDPKDRFWTDEEASKQAVINDLVRENIVRRDEIIAAHVFKARHGHPMYTLHYEKALAALLEAFAKLDNLETAGRQGRFQYINTHVAMKMGYEAADRLAAALAR